MEIKEIPIKDIKINYNIRTKIEKSSLKDLMRTIKEDGLLHPICVNQNNNEYGLIYGYRRYLACQKLGWKTIPCIVESDLEQTDIIVLNAVENLQRKENNVAELGRTCHVLHDKLNLSFEEIAVRLSIPKNKVQDSHKLFTVFPKEILEQSTFMSSRRGNKDKANLIPATTLVSLAGIKKEYSIDDKDFQEILNVVKKQNMTVSNMVIFSRLMKLYKNSKIALRELDRFNPRRFDVAVRKDIEADMMKANNCKTFDDFYTRLLSGDIRGKSQLVL